MTSAKTFTRPLPVIKASSWESNSFSIFSVVVGSFSSVDRWSKADWRHEGLASDHLQQQQQQPGRHGDAGGSQGEAGGGLQDATAGAAGDVSARRSRKSVYHLWSSRHDGGALTNTSAEHVPSLKELYYVWSEDYPCGTLPKLNPFAPSFCGSRDRKMCWTHP